MGIFNMLFVIPFCIKWHQKSFDINLFRVQPFSYQPNLVYEELVQRVNEMNCGIRIGDKHFNIFCYADDILLASTTITGLQIEVMIDVCTDYVEAHGLNFNASKTKWTIKGKPPFILEATLMLNGTTLTKENTIQYLGAILGNDASATRTWAQRIKAANGSFFKLQVAGMHSGGLSPDAIRHNIHSLFNPVADPGGLRGLQPTP